MTIQPAHASDVYSLKITLVDSEPEVWRQVLIPTLQISLGELHPILQKAMGWQNTCSYQFQIGLGPDKVVFAEGDLLSAAIAHPNRKPLYYAYDPKSGWLHRIDIGTSVSTPEFEENMSLPVCIAGGAACPPENSGGVWGYDELLARLENTADPDYIDLLDKYGDLDPDYFSLEEANNRLESL